MSDEAKMAEKKKMLGLINLFTLHLYPDMIYDLDKVKQEKETKENR